MLQPDTKQKKKQQDLKLPIEKLPKENTSEVYIFQNSTNQGSKGENKKSYIFQKGSKPFSQFPHEMNKRGVFFFFNFQE